MVQPLHYLKESASQTAGPYVHIGLAPGAAGFNIYRQELGQDIAGPNADGDRITVTGTVTDGTGAPVKDVLIEVWQANAAGVYPGKGQVEDGFRGWGRVIPDFDTGVFSFETVKPGAVIGRNDRLMAPHLNLWLVARGINVGLNTRMYFGDESTANAADPVLNLIEQMHRRETLIARCDKSGYHFDICLQGDGETVFSMCEVTMSNPCIICVAITGSLPTKDNNPAVPITISEQIESAQEAFETGASIAHCHVRDDDGKPTSDPDRFARLKEGLETHCPGMIIQLSTGGRSGSGRERGGMLPLRPDMASLSVGSNNFPTRVYENSPYLVDWLAAEMIAHDIKPEIEAFDLGHLVQATRMAADGRLKSPLYVQFVMGVKNAMPADEPIFDFYIETLRRLAPDAQWCAAGIGSAQLTINEWSIAKGGHTRTGLEDNVRLDRDRLAPSNAALVQRAVDLCAKYDRPVATWQQAREILGLRTVTAVA